MHELGAHPAEVFDPGRASDMLRVQVSCPAPRVVVVAPSGELDLCSASLFRNALLDVSNGPTDRMVLDLSGLSFCSARGLMVLLEAQQRAVDLGISFATAAASGSVLRVLRITDVIGTLAYCDTLEEAVRELTV